MYSFNPFQYDLNPLHQLPHSLQAYLPSALRATPPPETYLAQAWTTLSSPITGTYTSVRHVMDAFFALPVLSFLFIPAFSSYSTSLNLLFFYLTWSTLVLSHPPLRVEIIGTLAVRLLFYVLPSLFFFCFDALLPSAAESLKAMGDAGLPLKGAKRSRMKETGKIVAWSLGNVLLSVLLQAGVELLFTDALGMKSALKVTTTLPMPWGIAKDLLKAFAMREILGYTLHRYLLHSSSTPLSSLHRTWHHALSVPYPLTATYDHPLPHLLQTFLPTFLPALLLRMHLLTYLLYTALLSLEQTFAYSGYSTVPTNFILGGIARRTDMHVVCNGEGNFGPWGLCDWVCGTSVGGDVGEDVVEEVRKHDLEGKVERGVQRGRKKAAGAMNGGFGGKGKGRGKAGRQES
ncbi:MAG: hypothetical protein Q9227_006003 [Pyrenula ochraceoflavens]